MFLLSRHHRHVHQHILQKDPVPRGGIVDENVGDRAHDLAVLNDGASAHALHDAPRNGQEIGVGDRDGKALGALGVPIDIGDLYVILLDLVGIQGT